MDYYTLQLADGRKLPYPADDIDFYPTIVGHIEDLKALGADPDTVIILGYPDPEYLYKVLTTDYMNINYKLDEFVRIANAVDFLGNDQILNTMMKSLVGWFSVPSLIEQFRANKNNVKESMRNLQVGPQYLFLQNTKDPTLDYYFQSLVDDDNYKIAISDDLSYVVIWAWNIISHAFAPVTKRETKFINIYKDGYIIKSMTNLPNIKVPDQFIIDNNGIMYSLLDSNVYILNPPDYASYLYKHINAMDISLSNNAKRYLSKADSKSRYEVTELDTGKVFRYRYPPMLIANYVNRFASPNMDLRIIQHNILVKGIIPDWVEYAHLVWIVDSNTQSWIDIPDSNVLKISYDEKIIAAGKRLSANEYGKYNVNIYEREGSNFMLMASNDSILGLPLFVSENLLLTQLATEEDIPNGVDNAIIKVYKIKEQIIQSPAAYEIRIPVGKKYDLRYTRPGPNNTYIFGRTPERNSPDRNISFFKYRIRPYDTLDEFLEAKLD